MVWARPRCTAEPRKAAWWDVNIVFAAENSRRFALIASLQMHIRSNGVYVVGVLSVSIGSASISTGVSSSASLPPELPRPACCSA